MITKIEKENILNAYKNASEEIKKTLEDLFGAEMFKKDIKERIKTFHDAYTELGNNHPYVISYEKYVNDASGEEKDIIAYLKLRIIVAALNEGWKPQFVPGERRWTPCFSLYTQDEADEIDEAAKTHVVFRLNSNVNSVGGVSYAYSDYDSSFMGARNGSRLVFKSEELAEYAGNQFTDIFADFLLGWESEK